MRDFLLRYPDSAAARAYFEERRWRGCVACPYCRGEDVLARTGKRTGYYRCRNCAGEFTVRTGTLLERSRVPLDKWLYALYVLATARQGTSSVQLAREIGVTQKTAWSMLARLRDACDGDPELLMPVREGDSASTGGTSRRTPGSTSTQSTTTMGYDELDRTTDRLLSYTPNRKPEDALQAIAGTPDRPLVIGNVEIPCYVLEDETRVLAQRGMVSGLGMARGGSSKGGGDRLAHFVCQKTLRPFVPADLIELTTNPLRFRTPNGNMANGYPATLLADVCDVVLDARKAGVLQRQQMHIAAQCETLVRGFARVGIIALVDEATGYQRVRSQRALAIILEKFISEELRPWTKTFPFEFYEQICRLRGWPDVYSIHRPSVIGKYTNDIVYDRLAPGVLRELKKRNPVVAGTGRRRHKHHQWFTQDYGHPKLREHLAGVIALMRVSKTWFGFRRNLVKAYPRLGDQMLLDYDLPGEE
ncbi:MAG: hypothetical protein F4Z74_06465 [Acidobacteria bacterium]|nr:hypothetical protein [Acidobacteriota bacterium]MYE42948.1 hypothetical protein [Acidobacteriota bacterium]